MKSVHTERMKANADVFDFELDQEDMERLAQLNDATRVGPVPDEFDF